MNIKEMINVTHEIAKEKIKNFLLEIIYHIVHLIFLYFFIRNHFDLAAIIYPLMFTIYLMLDTIIRHEKSKTVLR